MGWTKIISHPKIEFVGLEKEVYKFIPGEKLYTSNKVTIELRVLKKKKKNAYSEYLADSEYIEIYKMI